MIRFDFSVIRNIRKKRGITAEELARRANLTRATVANLESGEGNPTMETITALSDAFQLTPSDLVRLAEGTQCEAARIRRFKKGRLTGKHIWFPNFEIYHIQAGSGLRKESDPQHHENTAEVCLVLSGKIKVTVGGLTHELDQGMALRFKAMHDHYFDVIEDAEFLLMHHNLV